MGSRYLTDLADVVRGAGLHTIEMEGWHYRARGSGGYDGGYPNHVMVHHTASPPSSDGWPDANYCTYGDEDAPLANLYLNRGGSVWIMAGGATNTNGSGTCPHCGATDSMNSRAIGIEAGNNGVGEAWPNAQIDAYRRLVRALCQHYGIANAAVRAHFEYAPTRKTDPAGPHAYASGAVPWDMNRFRNDVAQLPGPQPPGDDDEVAYKIIRECDDATQTVWMSGVYWCSDLKNKWAVSLTPSMWDAVVLEFALRGWDATVYKCATKYMPSYGPVTGPTPAPAAGKKFDGWGSYINA